MQIKRWLLADNQKLPLLNVCREMREQLEVDPEHFLCKLAPVTGSDAIEFADVEEVKGIKSADTLIGIISQEF